MGDIAAIKQFIDLAVARGLGHQSLGAEHDVIYLPFFEKDDPDLLRLAQDEDVFPGLHFDEDGESWALFT